MSPAERARQIDKREFEAECAAIRQRAYALLKMKPVPEMRVREWLKRIEPKGSIVTKRVQKVAKAKAARTHAANAKHYTAFGFTRTIKEWAAETGLSHNTIRNRLKLGWTIEQALTHAPHNGVRPGVASNFALSEGTGAGSTVQETSNITFSGIDA